MPPTRPQRPEPQRPEPQQSDRADDVPRRPVEVDARFLLANERTLLAWLRTGLALQAAGVVVFQVADELRSRDGVSVALLGVGLACHLSGWWRYRAMDTAIREDRIPGRGLAPDLIVLATVVLSVALAALLVS